jgi:hypothetical protein
LILYATHRHIINKGIIHNLMSKHEIYPKALTARRLKSAIQLSKSGTIQGIANIFDEKPDTVTHWQQEKKGIPRRRLAAVAHFFHVESWVFTDESLLHEDFEKLIFNPNLSENIRSAKNIPISSPSIKTQSLETKQTLPETASDSEQSLLSKESDLKEDLPITAKRLQLALKIKQTKMTDFAKDISKSAETIQKWQTVGIPSEFLSATAKYFGVKEIVFTDETLLPQEFKIIINKSISSNSRPSSKSPIPGQKKEKDDLNSNNRLKMVGKIIKWDCNVGLGCIMPEGGNQPFYIILKDVSNKFTLGSSVDFMQSPVENNVAIHVSNIAALRRFAVIENEDNLIEELAEQKILSDEVWNFKSTKRKELYIILRSYLYNTYRRLDEEDDEQMVHKLKKIRVAAINETGKIAIFNTGLMSKQYKAIYAVFEGNDQHQVGLPLWKLIGYCSPGEELHGVNYLAYFKKLPKRAKYFENPVDLLYDSQLCLTVVTKQIIKDREINLPKQIIKKIPKDLIEKNDEYGIIVFLNDYLDVAIKKAKDRVHRNVKIAVPQYSFKHRCIQFLIPISVEDTPKVDYALVVQKEEDGYAGYSILTQRKAYCNARLIAYPHSDWLDPNEY